MNFGQTEHIDSLGESPHALRNQLNSATLALRMIIEVLKRNETDRATTIAADALRQIVKCHESSDVRASTHRREESPQVLVVEDEQLEAELLASYLSNHDFQVEQARDGLEALRKLRERPLPDVLILDMHMPRLNGAKTVTTIRCEPAMKSLKIVGVSGKDQSQVDLRAKVDLWFRKPVDPAKLSDAILQLCRTGNQCPSQAP